MKITSSLQSNSSEWRQISDKDSLAELSEGAQAIKVARQIESILRSNGHESLKILLQTASDKSGVSRSKLTKAREIIKRGTPNVVSMVESGQVNLYAAAESLRKKVPTGIQESWTSEDVANEGRKAHASRRTRKVITKQFAPWPTMKFPTPSETGFPVNGTMEQKDDHHRKYGRTPMFPKEVKDMINNDSWIGAYVAAIVVLTSESHPKPQSLLDVLDDMLAWVPKPDMGDGWGIQFSAKAKKHTALINQRLPIAIDQLTELRRLWDQRNVQ